MEPIDYWRLSDVLTIVQASLLVLGLDPAQYADAVEDLKTGERPHGYEAVKQGIVRALRKGSIKGAITPLYLYDINGNIVGEIEGSIDVKSSEIEVDSLIAWLRGRGLTQGFFFPSETNVPGYLDPNHPNYAPKLAAAIGAWEAVNGDPRYMKNGKSVKQNIEGWLEAHAAEFDLIKDDGEINRDAIFNQISKVANWQDKGGAPKTPGE